MSEPIPANENALCIAAIFEDFAIDHAPDGWPAVKQQHLNAAAQEIRRMNALCVQLYEAVDRLLSWERIGHQMRSEDIAFARQALAKATGGVA